MGAMQGKRPSTRSANADSVCQPKVYRVQKTVRTAYRATDTRPRQMSHGMGRLR